jgi:hypothetical protein
LGRTLMAAAAAPGARCEVQVRGLRQMRGSERSAVSSRR